MSSTDSIFVLMFTSGLLGGFGHCIGMCGPIVATYSVHLKRGAFVPHLLYSLGRITTYSLLGGLISLTGSFVSVIRQIERLQVITLAVIGLAMIAFGLTAGGWLPLSRRFSRAEGFAGGLGKAVKYISGMKTAGAFFPMGLVLGFIPCGLLYTALIAAAGAGVGAANHAEAFLRGVFLLFLFGLGTTPALVLLGRVVSVKGERLRGKLYKASAVVMILVGVIYVYRAMRYY